MTDNKVIKLLESSVIEDSIIAANYMIRSWPKEKVTELLESRGEGDNSVTEGLLSQKYIIREKAETWRYPIKVIIGKDYTIFLSWGMWGLEPDFPISRDWENSTI